MISAVWVRLYVSLNKCEILLNVTTFFLPHKSTVVVFSALTHCMYVTCRRHLSHAINENEMRLPLSFRTPSDVVHPKPIDRLIDMYDILIYLFKDCQTDRQRDEKTFERKH